EPGTAPDRFGREEGIVDTREMLGRNARTRVRDFSDDPVVLGPGRHEQPSAARHRIAGVQKQIQEHLLKLVLDPDDGDRRVGKLAANLDAPDLELMLEQREYVRDDAVQIDGPG